MLHRPALLSEHEENSVLDRLANQLKSKDTSEPEITNTLVELKYSLGINTNKTFSNGKTLLGIASNLPQTAGQELHKDEGTNSELNSPTSGAEALEDSQDRDSLSDVAPQNNGTSNDRTREAAALPQTNLAEQRVNFLISQSITNINGQELLNAFEKGNFAAVHSLIDESGVNIRIPNKPDDTILDSLVNLSAKNPEVCIKIINKINNPKQRADYASSLITSITFEFSQGINKNNHTTTLFNLLKIDGLLTKPHVHVSKKIAESGNLELTKELLERRMAYVITSLKKEDDSIYIPAQKAAIYANELDSVLRCNYVPLSHAVLDFVTEHYAKFISRLEPSIKEDHHLIDRLNLTIGCSTDRSIIERLLLNGFDCVLRQGINPEVEGEGGRILDPLEHTLNEKKDYEKAKMLLDHHAYKPRIASQLSGNLSIEEVPETSPQLVTDVINTMQAPSKLKLLARSVIRDTIFSNMYGKEIKDPLPDLIDKELHGEDKQILPKQLASYVARLDTQPPSI